MKRVRTKSPAPPRSESQFSHPNAKRSAWQVKSISDLSVPFREALENTLRPGEQPRWMVFVKARAQQPKHFRLDWINLPWQFSPDWMTT